MPTPAVELDPTLEIPEFATPKGSRPSRFIPVPGEKTEICIDGAVGYQLRSIPSNRILARFQSTLEAWPLIITMIDGGRSPRTLALDAVDADGAAESISAGPRLEWFARLNNGEPQPYQTRTPGHARTRVAESAP